MRIIGIVTPRHFQEQLILSLSDNWIDVFGSIPEFIVSIANNKLRIETKHPIPDYGEKK